MHRHGFAVGLICSFVLLFASAAVAVPCDTDYVKVQHKLITVLPTGIDDTENLQCALDLASALGPGAEIRLSEGTFRTAQLIIDGMKGVIRGSGPELTIINNVNYLLPIDSPDCNGAGPCFADAPPSAANRYPVLISVLGNDVRMSDFSIEIVGSHVTEVWGMWGFGIDGLAAAVQFYGSHATLRIDRIEVAGEPLLPDSNGIFGGLSSCLNMWRFSRPTWITGSSLSVENSTFRSGGGIYTYNLDGSQVRLSNNRFEVLDFGSAWVLSDMHHSQFAAGHNEVVPLGVGVQDVVAWPGNIGTGISSSWLLFDNNIFAGDIALFLVPGVFASDVTCLAVNNDVSQVVGESYMLNGNACTIVGQGRSK